VSYTLFADTYEQKDAVKIGDKTYASVEEAIADAKDGDTLTVLEDVELTQSVAVPANVELAVEDTTLTLAADAVLTVNGTVTVGENGAINAETS